MPFELSLVDLVSPYVLQGDTLGQWHTALSLLRVARHEIASDENGIAIRGTVEFEGNLSIDPTNLTLSVANTENHPENDASRRDPWIDIRDTKLDFQLVVPRAASQKVSTAVDTIGAVDAFATTAQVLAAYDQNALDAPPSDYPSTSFTLDLLLTRIVLRPPFLRGAKREPNGQLVPDPQNEKVKFTLPPIKFRLGQGSAATDPITADLLSLGAAGLDDPGDLWAGELIKMEPPYAFIGPSHVVGFGFRSGTLDLSDQSTPPEVLSQFGFDESWKGLYLREIRLFIAPHGARDFAIEAGVENLLIGIGASSGVTGDFNLQVLDQGAGDLRLGARFYDGNQRGYGIIRTSNTAADVQLPNLSRMVVDVEGGRTPITTMVAVDGGTAQNVRELDIDLSGSDRRAIVIEATDASSPVRNGRFTIIASRRPSPVRIPGTIPPGSVPAARIVSQSATQGGNPVQQPRLEIVRETSSTVTVSVSPARTASTQWSVNGTPRGASPTLQVDLPAGGPDLTVVATLPAESNVPDFTSFFRFDQPPFTANGRAQTETDTQNFSLLPDNTHTTYADDEGTVSNWQGGSDVRVALLPVLQGLPDNSGISIEGFASHEGPPPPNIDQAKRLYSIGLAHRRAIGLRAIIEDLIANPSNNLATKHLTVNPVAANMLNWETHGIPEVETRRIWWKSVAHFTEGATPSGIIVTAVLHRDPQNNSTTPPTVLDPPPPSNEQPAPPPSWFKQMGAKVRIVRNQFVACEITAKIDVQTAAENRLQAGMPAGQSGTLISNGQRPGANPGDGIIDLRLVLQIDDATDTVSIIGYYGADPADIDGLYMWGTRAGATPAPNPGFGLNFLGTTIAFMPLISASVGAVANDGALAELGMTTAMLAIPAAIAGLTEIDGSPIKVRCERVVWYGGEILFRNRPSGVEAVILFDLETALSMDVSIAGQTLLKIDRSAPLSIRYKAVGIRIGDDPDQPRFQFRPIFDASKGYTIDVSRPGGITIASPLNQILTILGARIARNNPLIFEIDLGFAVDLGVVSIERARVRLKFDPLGPPELTAFAASIDVPGAIQGRGYMEMNEHEIKGQIDVTLVPVQVRIAAGLGLTNVTQAERRATGVIVTLEVNFPVAIPLGNSGLGIYGFLGLFAMHYRRKEAPDDSMAPALAWLKTIAHGNPTAPAAWEPRIDSWAFGVGAVLGTMGSSVILNLKGVLLLELPGPRLLLMMKANLLAVLPELKGEAEGTFLAVIDLDMGRGTLTIGISIEFAINPLLELRIPVEAFFNFHDVKDWHLSLGRYVDPIHAKIFEVFEGSGYLMLSGKGFQSSDLAPGLPAPISGFAISTGLHVSIIWGSKSVGLYAEVAAGFDAVLGFDPFLLAGKLYIRGTLHIFIIDLSAWANLTVEVGELPDKTKVSRISGEICGKVEFLFFSIEGCVDFALGSSSVPPLDPPELFDSLKLISRSAALAVGTGIDKPIDGGILDGIRSDATPDTPSDDQRVPIDAIPLAMLSMPPVTDSTQYLFRGAPVAENPGTPNPPPDGWIQKGEDVFQYTLKSVELVGELLDGETPAVWWPQKAADAPAHAQVALLSWIPDPTPKAIQRSTFLEETLKETWGTVCEPAAPATSVLFTFLHEPFGPAPLGWILDGEAWPDPPGCIRSIPPSLTLKVTERWRTGESAIDNLAGVIPAVVEGARVLCLPKQNSMPPPPPALQINPVGSTQGGKTPDEFSANEFTLGEPALQIDPVRSARGRKTPDEFSVNEFTLVDLARRANAGEEITRSMLSTLVVSPKRSTTGSSDYPCTSRVLAAPTRDARDLPTFGDPSRADQLQELRKTLKFGAGPFDDGVVFHTGEIHRVTFLLFVHRALLEQRVVTVAATNGKDQLFDQVLVDSSMMIPPETFPWRWTDLSGPWIDDVFLVAQHQGALQSRGFVSAMVTIKGDKRVDRIQIGLLRQDKGWHSEHLHRPYYVAAAEVLSAAEFFRYEYDTAEQKKKQGVLDAAFGNSSSGQALLKPNTAYAVKVRYDAQRGKRKPGAGVTEITAFPNKQQTFWFFTDNQPPRRLDPWILCCAPEDSEHHYFGEMPIRLVFNTPDVGRIFAAYGKRLQIRLRASSFRAPPSTLAVPHPFHLTAERLIPVKASLLSPWEEVLQEQLTGSCVPISGERIRHSMTTLPIPLEPFTDYNLDIESVDMGAPDHATGAVVWRIGFTTGRFPTLAHLADSFALNRVLHRFSRPGELQAIGMQLWADHPEGNQLDQAMIGAGLEPMGLPETPRIIVFWEAATPDPQPAAILVDCSEPMWRSRKAPKPITDVNPPFMKQYEMTPTEWLRLEEQIGGDAVVEKIVPAPGGQRALLTLQPNSRGKILKLALRQVAQKEEYLDGPAATDQFFTIVETQLERAPWEEID